MFRAAKAGHAGTLDPLASGLLLVLFGDATKFAASLLEADKTYLASVRLGATTTTGDAEGEVTGRRAVAVSEPPVEDVLTKYRGTISQVPPMYSALKFCGQPLYALAREGVCVERSSREVLIHELELISLKGDLLELRVRCSKGTYVRTLAEDIGAALGTVVGARPAAAQTAAHPSTARPLGTFSVLEFGAKGDGHSIDTPAINKAIEAAAAIGGGTVVFPAGTYACYSIHLKSNVELHLQRGATILAAEGAHYDAAEPNQPWHI